MIEQKNSRKESGHSLVSTALVSALVLIVALVVMRLLGVNLSTLYCQIASRVSGGSVSACTTASPPSPPTQPANPEDRPLTTLAQEDLYWDHQPNDPPGMPPRTRDPKAANPRDPDFNSFQPDKFDGSGVRDGAETK